MTRFQRVRRWAAERRRRGNSLWVALTIAGMAWTSDAYASPISILPSVSTVNIGDTFSLGVWVGATDPGVSDDVSDLFAYQFSVLYNPLILSANSVSEGAFLSTAGSTFFIPGVIDNTLGLITFSANSLVGLVPGATGSGSLLDIEFAALATGTSNVLPFFDPNNGDALLDSSLTPIAAEVLAGVVNVNTMAPIPEPATMLLACTGLGALLISRRRKQLGPPAAAI